MNRTLRIIFFLIFFFFIVMYSIGWFHEAQLGKKSISWPQTTAILDSWQTGKHARARYHYTVAGKDYTSRRIEFCTVSRSPEVDADLLAIVQHGKTFSAYYNPDDPSQSVIIPGIENRELMGYIPAGAGILALGFFSLVGMRKARKQ